MRKIWLVIKREYLTRVRTKVFILSTVGLPLFSLGIFALTMGMAEHKTDEPFRISILDNLGGLADPIIHELTGKMPDGRPRFQLIQSWDRPASSDDPERELTAQIRAGSLDGFLEIPPDILKGKEASLHTRNGGDFDLGRTINRALTRAVIERRLGDRGIHVDDIGDVISTTKLSSMKVMDTGESQENAQSTLMQLSVAIVLYITLLVYGVMTMRSVLEEKTSRVVEILASSIKPVHLLAGKILGVAAVGTTQYLIWMATAALFSSYSSVAGPGFGHRVPITKFHLPASYLFYPVIFFLVGYFLYASIYAAIGAMVSSEEELQLIQMPVTILIAGCLILCPIIQRGPNSPMSVGLTLFPLTSPILMVYRIAVQTPPFWQIALSVLICAATTAVVIGMAARIYRVGILMYGKRPSFMELLRWICQT